MLNAGHFLGMSFALGGIAVAMPILRMSPQFEIVKNHLSKLMADKDFYQKVIAALSAGAVCSIISGVISKNFALTILGTIFGVFIGIKIAESNIESQKADFDLRLKLASGAFLDSVTICVSSGMSIRKSISEAVSSAPISVQHIWQPLVSDQNAEIPFIKHLANVSNTNRENVMGRIARTLLISQERGTPIINTLQSLGAEIRSETRRQLLEIAAKKDVAMMIPVVFGILPSITAVALYPAFISLSNM